MQRVPSGPKSVYDPHYMAEGYKASLSAQCRQNVNLISNLKTVTWCSGGCGPCKDYITGEFDIGIIEVPVGWLPEVTMIPSVFNIEISN